MNNPNREAVVWEVPECAVAVVYAAELMDGIRLAALEAFYAFPRGGAEIGGVLFGTREGARVCLSAWRPMPCEHALGPSFTLSANDRAKLTVLLRSAQVDSELAGLAPVGWFHSHTRSGVFLSEHDLELHRQYFAEPWQVALVLRPSLAGTRAGFFARDAGGILRDGASFREFDLAPLSGRALALPDPPPLAPEPARVPAPAVPIPSSAPAAPPSAPAPEQEVALPAFLTVKPRPRSRWWAGGLVVLPLVVVGAVAFATRDYWFALQSQPLPEAPAFGPPRLPALLTTEQGGQLHIRWNPPAAAVRDARAASLDITDGDAHTVMSLDPDRLRAGSVTYVRQTDRVEVRMTLEQPDGKEVVEYTSFLGKPSGAVAPAPAGAESELRQERDRLRAQIVEAHTQLLNQSLLIERLRRDIGQSRAGKPAARVPAPAEAHRAEPR